MIRTRKRKCSFLLRAELIRSTFTETYHKKWTSHCKPLSVCHYLTTSAKHLPEAAVLTSSFCCAHHITNFTVHQTALIASFWVSDLPLLITGLMFFSLFSIVWQAVSSKNGNFSFSPCNKKYNFVPHVDKQYNLSLDLKTSCSFQIHLVIMSCWSPLRELV